MAQILDAVNDYVKVGSIEEALSRKLIADAHTDSPQSSQSQPIAAVWGRIYGKNIKIKSKDLINDEFVAGRGTNNDLVLTLNDMSEKMLCRISKVHFKIKRANCDLCNPVYIEDLSQNGTFVNGEIIGTNKTRILRDDDYISLTNSKYKAFVFKDLGPNEGLGLPTEITTKYCVSRELGSGACGFVRLIYDLRTCEQYAMKIVKKNLLVEASAKSNNLNDPGRVMNEAIIMKNLAHPCVIKMHEIVDMPDAVYMILEYMKGGDLISYILKNKRLSENVSKLYFYQICQAIKYLHDKGITHRDIKPDNILLQSSDEETLLKVSDFGLSKFVKTDTVMRTLCGTPLYVAPEVLLTNGNGEYTKKIDIWSLGVLLYACLSGTLPFSEDYGSPACEQIKKGQFQFKHPSWKNVSQLAKSLIKSMLIVDPQRRPTINEVLQHAWLLSDKQMLCKNKTLMKIQTITRHENEENICEPVAKRLRR